LSQEINYARAHALYPVITRDVQESKAHPYRLRESHTAADDRSVSTSQPRAHWRL